MNITKQLNTKLLFLKNKESQINNKELLHAIEESKKMHPLVKTLNELNDLIAKTNNPASMKNLVLEKQNILLELKKNNIV